jgi:hypothetical protein
MKQAGVKTYFKQTCIAPAQVRLYRFASRSALDINLLFILPAEASSFDQSAIIHLFGHSSP